MIKKDKKNVLITGCAGFIGFHLSKLLLENGYVVTGVDAITDYYDVGLKKARLGLLEKFNNFHFEKMRIETDEFLNTFSNKSRIDLIIHLAAQAGVRHSIENPREYVDTNLVGSFNVLEIAKNHEVQHLLMASTSSVYGSNTEMPFGELQKCDTQMSFYAATKKANEAMSHSYSHIHHIPTTMFRFFTVYGPWGRPDMALFKFAKNIIGGLPIDIYNHGKMERDFTFVSDLVEAIRRLIDAPPQKLGERSLKKLPDDSMSDVAPWRVVNIGNSDPVQLMTYVAALEAALGIKAVKNFMPMQQGDVPATFANTSLLQQLTGFKPNTSVEDGVAKFVEWYLSFNAVKESSRGET